MESHQHLNEGSYEERTEDHIHGKSFSEFVNGCNVRVVANVILCDAEDVISLGFMSKVQRDSCMPGVTSNSVSWVAAIMKRALHCFNFAAESEIKVLHTRRQVSVFLTKSEWPKLLH